MATLEQARRAYIGQLEARRRELEEELGQIEAQLRTLNGGQAAAPARSGKATSSKPRARSPQAPPRRRAPRGQRKQQVLRAVRKLGPTGPSAVAKEVGIAPSQAAKLLSSLGNDKAIAKTKNGWKVTSRGATGTAGSGE